MRRLTALFVVLFCISATAATALASGYFYLPTQWVSGGSHGQSTYSTSWALNTFYTDSTTPYKRVTFIDNVTYGWHDTKTGYVQDLHTNWDAGSASHSAYCEDLSGAANGGCSVYTN